MKNTSYTLSKIIARMITDVFEKSAGKFKEQTAARVTFVLGPEKNRQTVSLTLWAPGNYVYVFSGSHDSPLEEPTKLELLSCHDSCWRSDGVENWVHKNYENMLHLDMWRGFQILNVTAEMAQKFKQIEHSHRNS